MEEGPREIGASRRGGGGSIAPWSIRESARNEPTWLTFKLSTSSRVVRTDDDALAFLTDNLDDAFKRVVKDYKDVNYRYAFLISAQGAYGNVAEPPPRDTRDRTFYAIVPRDTDLIKFASDLSKVKGIATASIYTEPFTAVRADSDTLDLATSIDPDDAAALYDAFAQPYLEGNGIGINMLAAWCYPGARGEHVTIGEMELGWTLDHIDLYDPDNRGRIRRVHGLNQAFLGHGTAVLGVLAARDNGKGCTGGVPDAKLKCYSLMDATGWDIPIHWVIDAAVFGSSAFAAHAGQSLQTASGDDSVGKLERGDLLLIEQQIIDEERGIEGLPVEANELVFEAIRTAADKGIVVIEPVGNGGVDLDWFFSQPGFEWRGDSNEADSGAVLVAASTADPPRERWELSCYGTIVHCHSWGEAIFAPGDGWEGNDQECYSLFGGTSGAAAIVAAAAAAVQSAYKNEHSGKELSPEKLRGTLVNTGQTSYNPGVELIGRMPDVAKAIKSLVGPPPAKCESISHPADNDLSEVKLCGWTSDYAFGAEGTLAALYFVLGVLVGIVLLLIL